MSIILYTKIHCGWCREAAAFLKEKGIPFEEREVRGNQQYFDELVAKSGQTKAPTLDVNGEILADTDATAIEVFLKERKLL